MVYIYIYGICIYIYIYIWYIYIYGIYIYIYVYMYISNWIVEYIRIQLYSCTVNVNLMSIFIELSELINYCKYT